MGCFACLVLVSEQGVACGHLPYCHCAIMIARNDPTAVWRPGYSNCMTNTSIVCPNMLVVECFPYLYFCTASPGSDILAIWRPYSAIYYSRMATVSIKHFPFYKHRLIFLLAF